MNKRDLNYFLKVYEHKSIKKPTEDLFISSQGLSKTIENLESELVVQLFTRTAHGVEPTIPAHNLKRRAKIIIAEFENIASRKRSDYNCASRTIHFGDAQISYNRFYTKFLYSVS